MVDRARLWESVDDVLAAVGFLLVLGPLAVLTGFAGTPVWPELLVALVLLSAALGAWYRQRGYDIGDIGSFVFAVSLAIVPTALLVNGVFLLAGRGETGETGLAVTIAGAYGLAFWYAYGGGRERVRGRGA